MTISKHKSGYFYIYFTDPITNKRKSISCKTKLKSEALVFLSNFNSELKKRKIQNNSNIWLNDFIKQYLRYSSSVHTEKTTQAFINTFNHLNYFVGEIKLSELSTTLIKNYIRFRINSSSKYAARKDLINLRSALNTAVNDKIININPCKDIPGIKIPEKQPKFFTKEEYGALLKNILNPSFRSLVEIACNTGLRQMELITLKWEQVDLDNFFIILNNQTHITKGKSIRSIPLNLRAKEILDSLNSDTNRNLFVFSKNGKKYTPDFVSREFKKYVKLSGVNPKLNFHSLRHTFASWLVQRGVSIYHVSKLLGHADIKTTQIYAHLRADDLRNSVMTLD